MFISSLILASALIFTNGYKAPIVKKITDSNITETFDPNFDLIGDYIVNAYINDLDTLENYSNIVTRPANAICYINAEGYMTDKDGHSFDELYSDIYGWYLKDKMIPVFYIKDDASADSIIDFYHNNLRYDMGVMSTDPVLLSKVKAECRPLHMILDYSSVSNDELVLKDMVAESNTVGANTVVVSPSFATYQNMFYLESRLKTVWVNDENVTDLELLRQVTDGAYGCIVNNPIETIELLNVFTTNSVNKKYNYNRPIMNIAHRGLPQTMWENSLEGCMSAYEHGATHIEVDIQVTKDQKLAIMHDDTISRTTTGTGKISDYTAEELKEFKIDSTLTTTLNGEGVAIPMLDDIFNAFKGTDLVIIVEIKTSDINCVSILKTYLEEADIYDQVIVISFYTAQLEKMKLLIPEIPTADLNGYSEGSFMNSMNILGGYNMAINTNTANSSRGFIHKLAERGYPGYFWTYDNYQILYEGMKKGVLGITNNMADSLEKFPKKLAIEKEINIEGESFDDIKLNAKYHTYVASDSEEELEAVPFYIEKIDDNNANIIFQAKYVSGQSTPKFTAVLFSDVIKVHLIEPIVPIDPIEPSKPSSNNTWIIFVIVPSVLLIAAIPVTIIVIKRRKAK